MEVCEEEFSDLQHVDRDYHMRNHQLEASAAEIATDSHQQPAKRLQTSYSPSKDKSTGTAAYYQDSAPRASPRGNDGGPVAMAAGHNDIDSSMEVDTAKQSVSQDMKDSGDRGGLPKAYWRGRKVIREVDGLD
jgi:hypothetical protein